MTAQEYFDTYHDQSLLYAPRPDREYLRGQCVQGVCFYVAANGKPVLWVDSAYEWWSSNKFPDQYDRIANTPDAIPQPGDIVIWSNNLAGSGGDGHIAVVLSANGSTFVSVDQNWGGKTIHKVTHNYNQVVGWLRMKSASAPQGGNDVAEKITVDTSRIISHGVLARNGLRGRSYSLDGSQGDPWVGADLTNAFIQDVFRSPEASQWRDSNDSASVNGINTRLDQLDQITPKLSNLQTTINEQNQTITDLNTTLADPNVANADKQKALEQAMQKLGIQNALLAETHDQITDTTGSVPAPTTPAPTVPSQPSPATKFFAALLSAFTKFKKK